MDAKVREILMKVKESAVDAGRSASKVATDLMNQAKLNLRIVELNSEIESAYKNLGKMLYAVHNGIETVSYTHLISDMNIQMSSVSARADNGSNTIIDLVVNLRSAEQLGSVMLRLKRIQGVSEVSRVIR